MCHIHEELWPFASFCLVFVAWGEKRKLWWLQQYHTNPHKDKTKPLTSSVTALTATNSIPPPPPYFGFQFVRIAASSTGVIKFWCCCGHDFPHPGDFIARKVRDKGRRRATDRRPSSIFYPSGHPSALLLVGGILPALIEPSSRDWLWRCTLSQQYTPF